MYFPCTRDFKTSATETQQGPSTAFISGKFVNFFHITYYRKTKTKLTVNPVSEEVENVKLEPTLFLPLYSTKLRLAMFNQIAKFSRGHCHTKGISVFESVTGLKYR